MRPLLVLEDTTRPRWRLFSFFAVEWWATGWAWAGPLFWVALGWAVAGGADAGTGSGALQRVAVGTVYGAFLWLANVVHTLGHVAAARVAGTPMDAVVVTSTRDVNVYRGAKREVGERSRVVRSMGGPLANAAVGAAAVAVGVQMDGVAGWLRTFGVFNLCIAVWTLMPVPTMDGWIVWRWVFSRGRRAP
ncbi:MAG TPA: hypothetical protein VLH75_06400 [Longimicrobiales bacterium]|nr:hypothetical protein [Longimicrobiales bacterium]